MVTSLSLLYHEVSVISFRPYWLLRQMRMELTCNLQISLSSSQ